MSKFEPRNVVAITIAVCLVSIAGSEFVRLSAQEQSEQTKDSAVEQEESQPFPMLTLNEFKPTSKLKVKQNRLTRARFPVIDIHTHFGFRLKGSDDALDKFVELMDSHQIAMCVSLDAKLGAESRHLDYLKRFPDRFAVFAHIDFQGGGERDLPKTWASNQTGFVRQTCEQLRAAKAKGICGVKFFKQFGLGYVDSNGKLLKIDDSRFDPIWKTCGELNLPVIIHTGDPAAFFDPIDQSNERYEELSRHPDWSFHGDKFPERSELLAARNRVIKKFPQTTFIGAHLAGNPEDLETVSQWLDEMPNLVVELASRIGELGRQPYTAREFIVKYQNRVLFGTDGPWPEERLTYYWRFLETRDENFPYSEKVPPPQGLWNIYGVELEESILRKIYFENALRILPEIRPTYRTAVLKLNEKVTGE